MDVEDMKIEVLPPNATIKYLGKMITFDHSTRDEIKNRIKSAWAKFLSLKDELTNKQYSLNCRLKLFQSTVSSTMLYGCAAWTLTKNLEQQIRRTQRQMLRMMIGSGRRIVCAESKAIEPWVDWLKRTTHQAEDRLRELKIPDWISAHRRLKLHWAKRLATTEDHTWTWRAMMWDPDPF